MKYKLLTLLFSPLLLLTMAVAEVPIDEAAWSRIDEINRVLTDAGRTAPQKLLASEFEKAIAVLRDPSFDKEYQQVREEAFAKDFAQADALTKRAAPALNVRYDGDYDTQLVNLSYFAKRAEPGSDFAEFLAAYPRYSKSLGDFNASASLKECRLPIDEGDTTAIKGEPAKQVAKEWKQYQSKWKDPFLTSFAAAAAKCLTKK